MVTRRKVLAALGLYAIIIGAPSRFASAEPPLGKTLRVGLLYAIRGKFEPDSNAIDRALADGLRQYGYAPGRNF